MMRVPRSSGPLKLAALLLTAGLVALPWSSAPARLRDDDDDEREERRALAKQSFVENCLMCHGEDMTTRQRLTTKQWTAEVEKMVNWGAPLPVDRKQPLTDYLAETYPSTQPAPPLERITASQILEQGRQPAASSLPSSDPSRGATLFATHCATCHGPNAKGGEIGVNLVEKPVLLHDDEFHDLMKQGRRRMPGFASVIDPAQRSDLLAWLRRTR